MRGDFTKNCPKGLTNFKGRRFHEKSVQRDQRSKDRSNGFQRKCRCEVKFSRKKFMKIAQRSPTIKGSFSRKFSTSFKVNCSPKGAKKVPFVISRKKCNDFKGERAAFVK